MRTNWKLSLALVLIMIFVMRWQGQSLITPVSPGGILDLEFARTAERLKQLKLFWNPTDLANNIYLDFLFIFSYTWFLTSAATVLYALTGWNKSGRLALSLAIAAGFFDILENFLMLLVFQERFSAGLLELVYWIAIIKFAFVAIVIVYILISLIFYMVKTKPDKVP